MVLEAVTLYVKEGNQEQFEIDFREASQYISSIEGYIRHTLKKCIEKNNQYLLLVEWVSLEAHEIGFRKSPQYLKWKELLHHHYSPFPEVFHYEEISQG